MPVTAPHDLRFWTATPPGSARRLPGSVARSRPGGRRRRGKAAFLRPGAAARGVSLPPWRQCDHVLVPDNVLSWPEVAARLAAARNYWLCTTTSSGAPHAVPVWGVVAGQVLYLYSERSTVKARNLAANPRVVVHLESGEDVVIVRGTATDLGTPAQVPGVVAALSAKYASQDDRRYLPDADPDFDVVYAITPQSAAMWRLADYEASQRRWTA